MFSKISKKDFFKICRRRLLLCSCMCRAGLEFTKIKRRRPTRRQPEEKSAYCSAMNSLINRLSNASFVPPSLYIGFRYSCLKKEIQTTCIRCRKVKLFCRRPCSAPTRRPAERVDPTSS